jgi:hypothetical protein
MAMMGTSVTNLTRQFDPDHVHVRIYAMLFLSAECERRVHDVLHRECGVPRDKLVRQLHLTVYECRRMMPGLLTGSWPVRIAANIAETRFMLMGPGGENPRPDLTPDRQPVGVRLTSRNTGLAGIRELRTRLIELETPQVLGSRERSTMTSSAFGARNYQPHVTLVKPGSGLADPLAPIAIRFREAGLETLDFDRFEIKQRVFTEREHSARRLARRSRLRR